MPFEAITDRQRDRFDAGAPEVQAFVSGRAGDCTKEDLRSRLGVSPDMFEKALEYYCRKRILGVNKSGKLFVPASSNGERQSSSGSGPVPSVPIDVPVARGVTRKAVASTVSAPPASSLEPKSAPEVESGGQADGSTGKRGKTTGSRSHMKTKCKACKKRGREVGEADGGGGVCRTCYQAFRSWRERLGRSGRSNDIVAETDEWCAHLDSKEPAARPPGYRAPKKAKKKTSGKRAQKASPQPTTEVDGDVDDAIDRLVSHRDGLGGGEVAEAITTILAVVEEGQEAISRLERVREAMSEGD